MIDMKDVYLYIVTVQYICVTVWTKRGFSDISKELLLMRTLVLTAEEFSVIVDVWTVIKFQTAQSTKHDRNCKLLRILHPSILLCNF